MTDLSSTPGAEIAAGAGLDDARTLVRQLAEALGVRHAFLGRIVPDRSAVETVAAWVHGRFDDFAYDLAGSPCENVVETGMCVFPRDVTRLFPGDAALALLGAESYAGIVVRDDEGLETAVLAGVGVEPLSTQRDLKATLRLFAVRARRALERLDGELSRPPGAAPRRRADRSLQVRDEILTAVADGAERLLRVEPWTDAATEVLELLCLAARVDRATLFETEVEAGIPLAVPLASWQSDREPRLLATEPLDVALHARLAVGEVVELGDDHTTPGGRASELLLPIRVRGELCGFARFDDLEGGRRWSRAEKDVLRTAAGMFGAAVERDRAARDLRSRERILHAVAISAQRLLAASSWQDVIDDVLGALGAAIDSSRAFLCQSIVEPGGRVTSTLTHEWLADGVAPSAVDVWTGWVEDPSHVEALLSGRASRGLARAETGLVRETMDAEGTLSEINVPVLFDGALFGYIGFDDCEAERRWSSAEEEVLHIAAGLIGGAMAAERGERVLESRERILEGVAAVGEALLDAPSWRSCIGEVLRIVGEASGADRAQLFEVLDPDDPERVSLTALWARDGDRSELANPMWQSYRIQEGALESFLGGLVVSRSADEMPEPARTAMTRAGTRSFTSLPVQVNGRFWGLIGLDDCSTGRRWSAAENEALRAAAGMLGASVESSLTDKMLRDSEARLREAQKMEALGRLAAGIAHDFNNILTGVGGYAALLEESVDGTALAHVREILRATDHAAALVQQLVTIGKPAIEAPGRIDLGELVGSLEGVLRGLAGSAVTLTTTIDAAAPAVLADDAQLRQVVLNLVVNSVDAIEGEGAIAVRVEPGRDGSSTILTVEDTGCGMDGETLASVFEPFVTTRPDGAHVGLGLSIVYGVVQATGGSIELSSERGRGTTAVVSLPAAPDL